MSPDAFLSTCDRALLDIAQTEELLLQFGGRNIRSSLREASARAAICAQFLSACSNGQQTFSFESPTPELGRNDIECSELTGGEIIESSASTSAPPPAEQQEKDCSQYPNSFPESGGCKCKDGYKPDLTKNACVPSSNSACEATISRSIWSENKGQCVCRSPYRMDKNGSACLLPEGKEAEETIAELETQIANLEKQLADDPTDEGRLGWLYEKPPTESRGLTERFFRRTVPLLPNKAMKKLARRFTTAANAYRAQLEEAKIKLAAAKADLIAGQTGSAAINAKEAKELVGGVPAQQISAQACAINATPRIVKQGAYTVIPSLSLLDNCDCRLLDFTVMKRTLRVYGPVPKESYALLATIPACQAVAGDLVNVSDPLDDIVINDHYGKRGLLGLYWTSAWLYGDVKVP